MFKRLGLFISLIATLFTLQVTFATNDCDTVYASLTTGQQLYEEGGIPIVGALPYYQCALEKNPQDVYLMSVIADIHEQTGADHLAQGFYDAVLGIGNKTVSDLAPDCAFPLSQFPLSSLRNENWGILVQVYHCALNQDPDNAVILTVLGNIYKELDQPATAQRYYDRIAPALTPTDVPVVNSKHIEPQIDTEPKQSILDATTSEASPTSPTAQTLKQAGDVFASQGEYELAIDQYESLLAYDPDNATTHFGLGYAYDILGRDQEALGHFERAHELNPNDLYTRYFLAISYSKLGMEQSAIDMIEGILASNVADGSFPLARGIVYRNLGDNDIAGPEFQTWMDNHATSLQKLLPLQDHTPITLALRYGLVFEVTFKAIAGQTIDIDARSHPNNPQRIDPLVVLLNNEGVAIAGDDDSGDMFDASLDIIAPYTGTYTLRVSHAGGGSNGNLILNVNGMAWRADDYRQIGLSALSTNDYDLAIETFSHAIALDGGRGADYVFLGFAYNQLGEYQYAIEEYQKALESYPYKSEVHANLGLNYEKLGDLDSAAMHYAEAIALNPDYHAVRCNLAIIYIEWGMYQQAVDELTTILDDERLNGCALYYRAYAYSHLDNATAAFTDYGIFSKYSYASFQQVNLDEGNLWGNLGRADLAGLSYYDWMGINGEIGQYDWRFYMDQPIHVTLADGVRMFMRFTVNEPSVVEVSASDITPDNDIIADPILIVMDEQFNVIAGDNDSGHNRDAVTTATVYPGSTYYAVFQLIEPDPYATIELSLTTVETLNLAQAKDPVTVDDRLNDQINHAENLYKEGKIWEASAILDQIIDDEFATTCSNVLNLLADEHQQLDHPTLANMLRLKAISDSTC